MKKVKIKISEGKAVITEGGDSFIGKVISGADRVNIRRQGRKTEVQLVKKPPKDKKSK